MSAVEQHLKIAERMAACIEDRRDPDRVVHGLAEMIRYRALLIAGGYPDGNNCDVLRSDPAIKMAVGQLPESGADLCSQPTIRRASPCSPTKSPSCRRSRRAGCPSRNPSRNLKTPPPASQTPPITAPPPRRGTGE